MILLVLRRNMYTCRVFNILSRQIEDDVERSCASLPLDLLPQVYLPIVFQRAEGDYEVEVVGVKGLAQIGGEGHDGFEQHSALVDNDPGRLQKANCVLSQQALWRHVCHFRLYLLPLTVMHG